MPAASRLARFTRLFVGGKELTQVLVKSNGTVAINPGSIATVSRGTATGTITGAAVGDLVVMTPPSGLNDDLIFCGAYISAADTVTVYLYNPTGGPIDDASGNWTYQLIKVA